MSSNNINQEKELIESAQKDSDKFAILYEKYIDKIYNYVFHRTGDDDVAQEIVSQTFIKVLENLSNFKWQGYSISAWIYKIATNEINQFYRSNKKIQQVNISEVAHLITDKKNPYQQVEKHELKQCLFEFIKLLPKRQKEVLLLRFVEGLTNQEIGIIINCKEGAVRQLTFRALKNLRKLFEGKNITKPLGILAKIRDLLQKI